MVSFVGVFPSFLFGKSGLGLKLSALSSSISEFESLRMSTGRDIFRGVERSKGAVPDSLGLGRLGLSLSDLFLLTSNPALVSVDKSAEFSSISGFTSARSFC